MHEAKVMSNYDVMFLTYKLRIMPFNKLKCEIFEHQTLMLESNKMLLADSADFYAFVKRNLNRFQIPFPVTTGVVMAGLSSTKKWIQQKKQEQEDGKSVFILVRNRLNGEIVLSISVFGFDWRVPKCEIAWMLDEQYEGLGIATRVAETCIHGLINDLGVNKIICRIEPENHKSRQLAFRLGFQAEGLHKKDFRNGNNELVDVEYYGLCKD